MKVVYTDRAWKDLELAFEWYEEQSQGLGEEHTIVIHAVFDCRQDPEKMP